MFSAFTSVRFFQKSLFTTLGFVVLSLPSLAHANQPAIDLELTKDWKIWLRGPDCDSLKPQVAAFALWKLKSGEAAASPAPSCACQGTHCKVEVTQALPAFTKKVLGIFPENDGPNCWNTALVSAGILPHLRGTEADEFKYWMSSPLCTELKAGEKPEAGDVMAIRSSYGSTEEHAFIYGTEELSFSKKTFEAAEPYRMLSTDEIYGRPFNVKRECRALGRTDCETQVHAFRCINMKQYLSDKALNARVSSLSALVESIEAKLEIDLFTSAENYQSGISALAKKHAGSIEESLILPALQAQDLLLLKGLLLRTQSIMSAMRELR
ncbi:MAG: hypothetical protein H7333_04965 [Bdellovibrionales bacterium]|nr:hypothetical protein [Oligoflexia bacterium]